jgi:hypothetical protein
MQRCRHDGRTLVLRPCTQPVRRSPPRTMPRRSRRVENPGTRMFRCTLHGRVTDLGKRESRRYIGPSRCSRSRRCSRDIHRNTPTGKRRKGLDRADTHRRRLKADQPHPHGLRSRRLSSLRSQHRLPIPRSRQTVRRCRPCRYFPRIQPSRPLLHLIRPSPQDVARHYPGRHTGETHCGDAVERVCQRSWALHRPPRQLR